MVGGVRRHVRKPVEGPVRDDDDVGRRRKKKIEKRERRGEALVLVKITGPTIRP